MENKVLKSEGLLRLFSLVLASSCALLVGLDTQTKTVFFMQRKATVKDLGALWVLTVVASIAAGYHLIQFCKCLVFAWYMKNPSGCNKFMAWICFLLDQGMAYVMFTGTLAAFQASAIAAWGVSHLQWTKLCNIYTRFCHQVGGGLVCGLVASAAMAVISGISAHHLFKLYPSHHSLSKGGS